MFFSFLTQIKQEQSMGSNMMNDTNSDDDSYTDDESPKKRRDLLVRRPSYRKILNDLGGGEIGKGFLMIATLYWKLLIRGIIYKNLS